MSHAERRSRQWCLAATVAALVIAGGGAGDVARAAGEEPRPRITVVGTGTIETAPDTVELRFAVEHTTPTAGAARNAAAASATKVLQALQAAAGKDARVETVGYSLSPVYRRDPEPRAVQHPVAPEIVAYTAVQQILVVSRRVDAVGSLIDGATGGGAARIDNLRFTLGDPAAAQDQALAAAGADAARQAAAVARSLGVRLTTVLDATVESGGRPMYAARGMAMAAEAMVDTPVAPGVVTTEARVHVSYGIE
jgi:hypothetical protein